MEITLMTVGLLLLAALIATAIRLYDFPVTKVTKETILDAVKVFVYALIAAFLSLYLLELAGLTLDLENFGAFIAVVAASVGGMATIRAILDLVQKFYPKA